jgi:hypothetical protein
VRNPLQSDVWELYDTRADFSLANDLSARHPDKLAEMQALFMKEAAKHHVLPLDDRLFERALASAVGRPDLMGGRTSLTLAQGMAGMMENVFINVKNKSKTITAEVELPASGANGAILAQGGRFGGWSLCVKDGVPAYDYNFLGLMRSSIAATKPLAPGKATIRFDFAYDGGGMGKGGTGTLFVNDEKVAQGRIEHTQAMIFSADETADVGIDLGTPVVEAIGAEQKSRFTGRIPKGGGAPHGVISLRRRPASPALRGLRPGRSRRPGVATVRRGQPRSQVPRSIARIDACSRAKPVGRARRRAAPGASSGNGQFNFLSFQALVPWTAPPACSPALVSVYSLPPANSPVPLPTVRSSPAPAAALAAPPAVHPLSMNCCNAFGSEKMNR